MDSVTMGVGGAPQQRSVDVEQKQHPAIVASSVSTRFDDDTALTLASDGSFTATVSGEWTAGRGPHGGYIAAIILRGLMDTVADSARQPRSLTVHYARAPEPGPVTLHTVLHRAGR